MCVTQMPLTFGQSGLKKPLEEFTPLKILPFPLVASAIPSGTKLLP